jgi:hypothetical protein
MGVKTGGVAWGALAHNGCGSNMYARETRVRLGSPPYLLCDGFFFSFLNCEPRKKVQDSKYFFRHTAMRISRSCWRDSENAAEMYGTYSMQKIFAYNFRLKKGFSIISHNIITSKIRGGQSSWFLVDSALDSANNSGNWFWPELWENRVHVWPPRMEFRFSVRFLLQF